MVWVHDYHLMLLPAMLREEIGKSKKNVKLGFFLHLDEVLSWFEPDVEPTWFAMVRVVFLVSTHLPCHPN